jgi:hypothetical protein
MVFIPAGLQHCPVNFKRIDRPIFHFTSEPGKMCVDEKKVQEPQDAREDRRTQKK